MYIDFAARNAYNKIVMSAIESVSIQIPPCLLNALKNAGDGKEFSEVLKAIATMTEADACILWERLSFGDAEFKYFALAEFSKKAGLTDYYLPQNSLTEKAVAAGIPQIENDLEQAVCTGSLAYGIHALAWGAKALCSIPLRFYNSERQGAINLYRSTKRPFTSKEVQKVASASETIAFLFHTIRTEKDLKLLNSVQKKLYPRGSSDLSEILKITADAFNAVEASVYMEDPTCPDLYRMRFSVWPWKHFYPRRAYGLHDSALTAWTLRNGRVLRFFNLENFEQEAKIWKYENIAWTTKAELLESAKTYFNSVNVPPLGFICVPIHIRGRVAGAIRCCGTKTGPHFFDDGHIETLKHIAHQIGSCDEIELRIREEHSERDFFERFSAGVGRLIESSFKELDRLKTPKDSALENALERQFNHALQLLENIGGLAEAMSVRLLDRQTRSLYIAAACGTLAKSMISNGERWWRALRFPVDHETSSGRAILEKRVCASEKPIEAEPLYELIPGASSSLHVPILVGSDAIGVLDFWRTGSQPFPCLLDTIAPLISMQFGLYYYMFQQFLQLKHTNEELEKRNDEQNRIYDDFQHQIGSPVQKAHFFAQLASREVLGNATLRALRGQLRLAEQVANSVKYFVLLSKGELTKPRLQILTADHLIRTLLAMSEDSESVVAESKRLIFKVDLRSFDEFRKVTVMANQELLSHAIWNLLDNAAKYSVSKTTVTVRAIVDRGRNHFKICVINKGFPIRSDDRKRLILRGVRGEFASLRVVEGRGIGLYIVKNFMEAMGGGLEIIPTDDRKINEFRLILPFTTSSGEKKDV